MGDIRWFCGAHLAERDACWVRLNGPMATDGDRVERPSIAPRPTRPPDLKQGRML